ncbi:hypothetical protein EST38_g1485 [Candolleomyces aberdarensis]|uniref:CHAT domain-containing protein n=1 Tax=Candolleomyces aberdarensis TaxID=2316362 RepID=A0A4Q2DVX0_9AGAR|nr:hypothetical protein EST38_g1485 [Candolleomyces aberdarensis]
MFWAHVQLADLLTDRFGLSKDERDLDGALSSYKKALEFAPQGFGHLSALHASYADAMIERHQLSEHQPHFDTALEHYQLAAQTTGSSPLSRFNAGRGRAHFASLAGRPNAMDAYQICVDLLPMAAGLDQTLDRRHDTLVRISDLSREASAFALRHGEPKTAVEWLEASRCLVWGQLNNLRTPLDNLHEYDEELADRFSTVSTTLEKSGTRKGPYDVGNGHTDMKTAISLQQEAVLHVELAAEYDTLLKTIRAVPGFERFLKAPSFGSLIKNLPKSGYVVVVNVDKTRCDAICISSDNTDPFHVPLPDFSYHKAVELRNSLREIVDSFGMRMRGESLGLDGENRALRPLKKFAKDRKGGSVSSIFKHLWLLVVKPIIDELGLKPTVPQRNRMWWCLTGPLAFLAIHAAGIYTSTIGENVALSDFVISSYIPTLTSLAKASTPGSLAPGARPLGQFLLVSQSETKGLCPLPGAAKEVDSVARALDGHSIPNITLSASAATVDTTLSQIKNHNWLHFACHAYQDVSNPLNSGFVLSDAKLTLSEISKLGDERLSEEAVHLAAGMLAAGFKGVVATMWSIRDQDAPEMAKDFYGYLLVQSKKGIDSSLAAHALDHAVRRMKENIGTSDRDFLAWVPYVHFGA